MIVSGLNCVWYLIVLLFTRYNIACVAGWSLSLLRCALQLIALWYLVSAYCGGVVCGFCCFVVG